MTGSFREAMASRMLFFDAVRIISITIIILFHLGFLPGTLDLGWAGSYGAGPIAFLVLLAVSGAVLELTHHGTPNLKRRLLRIYPAYWLSLGFCFVFVVPKTNIRDWVIQIFGVGLYFNNLRINGVGWIMGLFVVLYFLYPYMSNFLKENSYLGLAFLFILSFSFKYLFFIYGNFGMWAPSYSFPLCNLIFFGLGIFIVQRKMYPHYKSPVTISFISELSYYVFLLQMPMSLWWGQDPSRLMYLVLLLMASLILYILDKYIQMCARSLFV
jgi:peptidoglycan/LPS O-acetylase OafA/YrhL